MIELVFDAGPFLAPTTVGVRAESNAGAGLTVTSWSVRGPQGQSIPITLDPSARQITFPADDPGEYIVSASGFAPGLGSCSSGPRSRSASTTAR